VKSSPAFCISPTSACPAASGLQIGLQNRFFTCGFLRFHLREHARSGLSVHPVTVGRPHVERARTGGFTYRDRFRTAIARDLRRVPQAHTASPDPSHVGPVWPGNREGALPAWEVCCAAPLADLLIRWTVTLLDICLRVTVSVRAGSPYRVCSGHADAEVISPRPFRLTRAFRTHLHAFGLLRGRLLTCGRPGETMCLTIIQSSLGGRMGWAVVTMCRAMAFSFCKSSAPAPF
jgi:hypothetical protein